MPIPLKLTVFRGSDLMHEEVFTRDIVKIGRLASAHLRLEDEKVSRIHAVIQAHSDGAGYDLIDMGSAEGTLVNGEKVSKRRLASGDEIVLGQSRVRIDLVTETVTPAPPQEAFVEGEGVPSGDVVQSEDVVQSTDIATVLAPASPGPPSSLSDALGWSSGSLDVPPVPPSSVPPGAFAASAAVTGMHPQPSYSMPLTAPQAYVTPHAHGHTGGLPAVAPVPAQARLPQGVFVTPVAVPAWQTVPRDAWGTVPNNLASKAVSDTERELEVKTLWGSTVLDTINAFGQSKVTMGDERRVTGWGPFQKVHQADVEVPSKGLPSATWVLAESSGGEGCHYVLHLPPGYLGRIERADGMAIPFDALRKGGFGAEPGDHPGAVRYRLQAEETVYLAKGQILHQIRYVRKNTLVPPPWLANVNYTWLNILVLVFFVAAMAVTTFVATPMTRADPAEELYKNSSRFAQFRLMPEKKRSDMLSQLKGGGPKGAKAAKKEGKAGRKDSKRKTRGRMSAKGDPSKKDLAQNALQRLFGRASQSGVFGRSGLGGELKNALGGISGARVGDAAGLGGLGTRGAGPGGGGLDMSTVGLGALGTRGRGGGGDGSYGEGATGIGRKIDRDVSISAGSPIIMGSLDKEIIRRIIKQHIAQIRYCYEKELVRSPGLFGKVATQFTISAEGRVQSAKVAQTTLNNAEVERCMMSKIRTWRFPKPKGGGIVIVKYPFILKTAG